MKGVAYVEKYSMVIATNPTSICCVYKEKIVKEDSHRRTQRPQKFRKLQYSTRIVKNQFKSKQIIQILQPPVQYRHFSRKVLSLSLSLWYDTCPQAGPYSCCYWARLTKPIVNILYNEFYSSSSGIIQGVFTSWSKGGAKTVVQRRY